MTDPLTHLEIHVDSMPDDDGEDLARLTRQLRQDILELNVHSVNPVRSSTIPPGAKGDPLTLSSLAVTLAPAVLTALTNVLQSWLTRHERASVTLEHEGRKLTVTGNPTSDQQRLLEGFIKGK
jgi:hypothetical protein